MLGISERLTQILAGAFLAAVVALGVWCTVVTHQRNAARSGWEAEKLAHADTVKGYRLAAEKARADDLANARQVEQRYATIASEKQNALQDQLASARADADAYAARLRTAATAHSSGGKREDLPQLAGAASVATGTGQASELDDVRIAAENAVKAEAWLAWYKAVAAAPEKP